MNKHIRIFCLHIIIKKNDSEINLLENEYYTTFLLLKIKMVFLSSCMPKFIQSFLIYNLFSKAQLEF